jgi:hypothetical protein
MTQALYAHMNNKTIKKQKRNKKIRKNLTGEKNKKEPNIIKPLQVKDIHQKCSPFHCQDHICVPGWVTSFILIKEISKFLKKKIISLQKKKKEGSE